MTDHRPPDDRPRNKQVRVICDKCQHKWVAAYLPMLMDDFAKIATHLHCPNCASGPADIFVDMDALPD